MDIIILSILIFTMLVLAALDKEHPLLGLVAGIGLIMIGLGIMASGVQFQTGSLETVNDTVTNITFTYGNVTSTFAGFDWLLTIFSVVIGAAGLFIFYSSIMKVKL